MRDGNKNGWFHPLNNNTGAVFYWYSSMRNPAVIPPFDCVRICTTPVNHRSSLRLGILYCLLYQPRKHNCTLPLPFKVVVKCAFPRKPPSCTAFQERIPQNVTLFGVTSVG